MTSVEPMGRYGQALRRLGFGPAARHFFEVHVVADAHHERVAAHDLAGGLAAQNPRLSADILFGARCAMAVEGAFSVVCGFGRFGTERWALRPDMICFAKGVTSGYLPLGGVVVSGRVSEPFWSRPGGPTFAHSHHCAGFCRAIQACGRT
jgi:hypothetical protein